MKTAGKVLEFCVIAVIVAIIEAVIIVPSVIYAYPDVDWKVFVISVILNTSLFPILFGIPLIILMREELGFEVKTISRDK